ncbi:hypothetical protein ABI057_15765, partial [Enterococcus faecium]|uniref:Lhr family ATP-dependent helicase n=1 Tax=Enterococcus faecium TaxID=1352 RepID=UPI003F430A51
GVEASEYCHARVLSRIRGRALARARDQVAPASPGAQTPFSMDWHRIGAQGLRGADGVMEALDALAGAALPASMWESAVLPARVA